MTPRSIVYVTSRWGEPSQTFVRREAAAVAAQGVEVSAASLKRPGPVGDGVTTLWLAGPWVALGLLRAVRRRPGAVVGTLAAVVRARPPLRNLGSHLVAAAIGIAWVGARRLPPGHLHAQFGWVAATAAWAAARVDGRTYSVMLHAFEIHDERYRDSFTPTPLRDAAQVFVASEQDRRIVGDRWAIAPEVVRIGVPEAWLDTDDSAREADLIVAVGRLVEKKGYPDLLAALTRTTHPWRLEIIGAGPLGAALEAQVAELGLADRVTLRGGQPEAEVQRSLRRAAVMCLSSVETPSGDRDGTPMSIVEAMACGAVVVSTDAGAIAELVGDGGVVVGQRDVDALVAALDRVADPSVRAELAALGRARVRAGWTSRRSAETLLAALGS